MTGRSTVMVTLAFLLLVSAGCLYCDRPPSAVPANAAPGEFSAVRALGHLNHFAQAPHPIGSEEHDRASDYLVAQLAALGATPQIQRAIGVTPLYQVAGSVENIVARLKGTSGATDALALVAHYDSVPAGPGAGDDGAGVAALLETTRVLGTAPPLRNDVIVLFTDGEEAGLLGASAFLAEHPWAKDIRVAVNLEARGNRGISQLFETSQGNGSLIEFYSQAAAYPEGTSLTYEIYKRMPNDTDMTLFKQAGTAVMNFAFIGNWEAYHTPLDNPQRLDLGSLQHHGENALSLARSLGNADLSQLRVRDVVFASVPPRIFFHYGESWTWPLALLCSAVFLGVALWSRGAFETRATELLLGLAISLGILVFFVLIAVGFVRGVAWLHLHWLPEGNVSQSVPYLLSLIALLAAVHAALRLWTEKRITPIALSLGGSLLILLMVLATSQWLPGGSFVFAWPLLFLLIAIPVGASESGQPSALSIAVLCLSAVPVLLLFVPMLRGFFSALGFTVMGAPVLALFFGSLLVFLGPLLTTVLSAGRKLAPLVTLLLALVFFAAGAATTRYSAEHPKSTMLAYALDADSGEALWVSTAARLDAWTAQYVGMSPIRAKLQDFYPSWLRAEFLQSRAPAVPTLAPPEVQLVETLPSSEGRVLHLRVSSPRHARELHVFAPQVTVLEAAVNGHALGKASAARWRTEEWNFSYSNLPPEGIDLVLHTRGTAPARLIVTDQSAGLPAIPGANLPPRPADSMPFQWGDTTMVRRSFVF